MQIRDMFLKNIDRDLQGVIIVGQDENANVKQELEEYVVTRELQKHFADFFSAYKQGIIGNTTKTGVWISGFFGSGKSHLLKILSYLLENKEIAAKEGVGYEQNIYVWSRRQRESRMRSDRAVDDISSDGPAHLAHQHGARAGFLVRTRPLL